MIKSSKPHAEVYYCTKKTTSITKVTHDACINLKISSSSKQMVCSWIYISNTQKQDLKKSEVKSRSQ